jgi:hypothetical protein
MVNINYSQLGSTAGGLLGNILGGEERKYTSPIGKYAGSVLGNTLLGNQDLSAALAGGAPGFLSSILNTAIPNSNPALNYITSNLGSTVGQQLGVLPAASLGGATLGGLGAFMAGQNTFTNPYSSYLSAIPFVGSVLGGLLQGVLGGKDPLANEPISPDWFAAQQRKYLDPRWGSQGTWKEEYDPTTKAGYGKPAPTLARPTDAASSQWYLQDWAPYASQLFSPHGLMELIGQGGYQSESLDTLTPWTPPVGSPLEKWWKILEARDKANQPASLGKGAGGEKSLISAYYTPGRGIVGGDVSGPLISYMGVNPFAGLSQEDINFFYQPGGVLDYIDTLLPLGNALPPSSKGPPTQISHK